VHVAQIIEDVANKDKEGVLANITNESDAANANSNTEKAPSSSLSISKHQKLVIATYIIAAGLQLLGEDDRRPPEASRWRSRLALDVGEGQKQTRCIDSPVRRRGGVK
jgi:hypothetical protein